MTKSNLTSNIVYVDSNVFIYSLLTNAKYTENANNVIGAIRSGRLRAVTASLTFDEVLWTLSRYMTRDLAVESMLAFFRMLNLEIVSVDARTMKDSLSNYMLFNLRPRDAIHLAVMRSRGITSIITADQDFKNHGMIDLAKFKV